MASHEEEAAVAQVSAVQARNGLQTESGDAANGSPRMDFARPDSVASPLAGAIEVQIPTVLLDRIGGLAGGNAVLSYIALLTAVAIHTARHAEQDRFVIFGPGLAQGASVARAPILIELERCVTFEDALESVQASVQNAYRLPATPALRGAGGNAPSMIVGSDGLHGVPSQLEDDVQLWLTGTVLRCRYNQGLFRQDTFATAMRQILALLEAGLSAPQTRIADLWRPLAGERDLIVDRWNDTAAPYERERSLQSLFNAAARENPDRVCCVCEGRSYTYAQLASAAQRIASALQTRGLSPGAVAAVFVGRTYCAIAAIAGIIGAGAAYLPLDRMYPRKRIAYLLADANPAFVLAERRLLSELPECSAPVLCIEELLEDPAPAAVRDFSLPTAPSYLIYTSGSTGKPKGVALDHRGRVNNFSDFNRRFRIGPGDCVLGISSLSFDMSAYDILGTLMAGGKVLLVSEEEHSRPEQWLELMEREQVTLWHSVPSLMESFLDHIERHERAATAPGGLRLVLLGGDWIPVGMAARIHALWPAAEVVSLGGATEVSMDSTIYSIDAPRREWKSVPYGRAMANQKAYVLDTRGDLTPIGIAGELFLGGDGVAWGYHKQPALTAAKFVPDGFTRSAGARLYATGDHARYQPDGQLELLGRMDFQVKIRGQRIELGEVEAAVQSFPGITRAVALVNKDERGAQVLTAYVVADRPLDLDALRKHLVEQLPVQMVPSQMLLLPQLPLSANGKVDRNALRRLRVPVAVAAAAREAPAVAAEAPAVAAEAPADAPEAPAVGIVRSLFCEILSVPQVEAEEDFFALGGHSLLALRLISRLEEVFKIKTPLHVVFESPTAGKLAAYIEHQANQANLDLSAVKRLWQSVEQMSEQEVRDVALRERMSG